MATSRGVLRHDVRPRPARHVRPAPEARPGRRRVGRARLPLALQRALLHGAGRGRGSCSGPRCPSGRNAVAAGFASCCGGGSCAAPTASIVNGASGERYVARFGVAPDRIDRIPYVAVARLSTRRRGGPASAGLRNLLFVGQLTERKGLLPFLEALDAWSRSNPGREVTFTIAGGGPQLPALQHAVHRRLGRAPGARRAGSGRPAGALRGGGRVRLPDARGRVGRRRQRGARGGLARPRQRAQPGGRGACARRGRPGWIFDPEDRGIDARRDRPRVRDTGGAAAADERQRAGALGGPDAGLGGGSARQTLLGATRASR